MKTTIVSRKYEVTDDLKERLEKKLGKLDKFFASEAADTSVTFSEERGRHRVEITIFSKGTIFRAEVFEGDPISSIDKAVDIIERQIRKNKTKLERRLHESNFAALNDGSPVTEESYKISKVKKFAVKPMSIDEAVLQMNLIGHEFFLFLNEETNEVNLVYKRKNNDYGVIIPEL